MAYEENNSTMSQPSLFDQQNKVESPKNNSNENAFVAIDSLEVCSRYLASLQDKVKIDDTKNALIRYFRLFRGSPGVMDSGSDLPPVRVRLLGVWCSKLELPGLDVKADSGDDGDTILKATLNYDDVLLEG